jgi:hypothetical protein
MSRIRGRTSRVFPLGRARAGMRRVRELMVVVLNFILVGLLWALLSCEGITVLEDGLIVMVWGVESGEGNKRSFIAGLGSI